MDSGKWTILTPILVALIPVVAGIVTIVVNVPSSDKAVVTIETSVDDWSPQTGQIMLKNIGGAPATNITVFVESQSLILTAEQSSFVNIVLPKFNNSTMSRNNPQPINDSEFQFMIPKLIQGDGGFIKVTLRFDQPQTREGFHVVVIYDQGSAIGKEFQIFQIFYYWSPIFTIIYVIAVAGEIIFFTYYFLRIRRKEFIKSLLKNLFNIRRKLITDRSNNESFTLFWEYAKNRFEIFGPKNKFAKTTHLTPKFFKNVSDYIKVDDLLHLITRREDKRNSNQINDLNAELLTSINNLLKDIEWRKYN